MTYRKRGNRVEETRTEENQTEEKQSEVQEDKKLSRKERRKMWKAAKKDRRQQQKEYYRYAPWIRRVWGLYLKVPALILLIIAILAIVLYANRQTIYNHFMDVAVQFYMQDKGDQMPTEEELARMHEMSPLDEEGAARVDAIPRVGKDETWTICVYLVGADLEDMGEDHLSELTAFEAGKTKEDNRNETRDKYIASLNRFEDELKGNNLELPAYFYEPHIPATPTLQDGWKPAFGGAASADIKEMTSGVWSDNVKLVMQTGGARRWENRQVNPNRTQRFLYHKGEMREVSNVALQDATDPDTLADFLRFCKTEYPADHQILILWNHGGGPFGYGVDSIYGNMMSLADIRDALSKAYTPNIDRPPFDLIGFDACLMSTIEVTHSLYGFADYYCLSEEAEPGDGWDYGKWLGTMKDDPTMNAAQVGRSIADSYMDYYMYRGVNDDNNMYNVTFSVVDAKGAENLYEAYHDLSKVLLGDAAEDISTLALASRCANASTRYGGSVHDIFNTIDIGNYVDLLVDTYPEECKKVKDALKEAVLYHRENGSLADSTGMAVYFPAQVNTLDGLTYYLEYEYDVCEDEDVKTLYYYKQSGCLTDEMKEYVATLTDATPKSLDLGVFRKFATAIPRFDDEGFLIPVSDNLQDMIAGYKLEVIRLEDDNTMVDYGFEDAVYLDGDGHLASDFDGKWIHINGVPLYVEVVSATDSAIEYKAHVDYNRAEAYLMISLDLDTEELSFTGVRMVSPDSEVMSASRSITEIVNGAKIKPIYYVTDLETGDVYTKYGKSITFSDRTSLTLEPFEDGELLMSAVVTDQRGDNYYSAVMGATEKGGRIKDWKLRPEFYGRDYQ